MILNKFRAVSMYHSLKALSLQLLALSLFSCNKSADINANKSFIAVTHVAYGVGPVMVSLEGTPLYSTPLGFGLTTGTIGNPYDTATSRVSDMEISQDTSVLLTGNAAFQQGERYSMFVYDTLNAQMMPSVNLIVLQDNPALQPDTVTNIRYMNFSPSTSYGIKLVNTRNNPPTTRDIIDIGPSLFVGYNVNPSVYKFAKVLIGNYNVYAFKDSAKPNKDSSNFRSLGPLTISSKINYNVYLQGFPFTDTGVNKFQLKSVPLN